MCVVSAVSDGWSDKWTQSPPLLPGPVTPFTIGPSNEDFAKLKKQVEQLAKDLREAQADDEANGEPNCVKDEKVEVIVEVLDRLGEISEELAELREEILTILGQNNEE